MPASNGVKDDVREAARLLALGMRPKQKPARDAEYADLVRRYNEDDEFADITDAMAQGFDLIVLSVDTQSGIVMGARPESVFAWKFDEYAKRTSSQGRASERVIHGIAHLAIAALAFPRREDLANPAYVGGVNVADVDAAVTDLSTKLAQQAQIADENNDPVEGSTDLEMAWRAYSRRPKAAATKDGRQNSATTRGIVTKAMRFLADQGLLVWKSDERGGTYRTTPRYQVQVRELAATSTYAELQGIGIVTPADATSSLAVSGPDITERVAGSAALSDGALDIAWTED